jgi:hypothetical protein
MQTCSFQQHMNATATATALKDTYSRNLTLVMNSSGMMPIILAAASTAVMGLLSWSDLGFRMVK